MPVAVPNASTPRPTINQARLGANRQTMDPAAIRPTPARIARRRPCRSANGPQNSMPIANVSSAIENVPWTCATVEPKYSRTTGSAGQ